LTRVFEHCDHFSGSIKETVFFYHRNPINERERERDRETETERERRKREGRSVLLNYAGM
jgi:hypothetical protein